MFIVVLRVKFELKQKTIVEVTAEIVFRPVFNRELKTW
jgi:hypothetical protein